VDGRRPAGPVGRCAQRPLSLLTSLLACGGPSAIAAAGPTSRTNAMNATGHAALIDVPVGTSRDPSRSIIRAAPTLFRRRRPAGYRCADIGHTSRDGCKRRRPPSSCASRMPVAEAPPWSKGCRPWPHRKTIGHRASVATALGLLAAVSVPPPLLSYGSDAASGQRVRPRRELALGGPNTKRAMRY
jgi:hypothetical protein